MEGKEMMRGPMLFKYGGAPPTERQLEERAKQLQADIEAVGMARTFELCGRCDGRGAIVRMNRPEACPDCAGIGQILKYGRDEGKVCACGEPYHPTPIGDVCLVCGSRPPRPDITELLALCSKATCEHDLDDGRCLLCGFDLEYTPSS
jgi:hypothetical protein